MAASATHGIWDEIKFLLVGDIASEWRMCQSRQVLSWHSIQTCLRGHIQIIEACHVISPYCLGGSGCLSYSYDRISD